MKRYRALLGAKSHRIVIQREGEAIPTTIAWAGTPIDAEHIADALNGYEGAVDALEDFIAEVAAPTGRLRLEGHAEGDALYAPVKRARATLAALRGQ